MSVPPASPIGLPWPTDFPTNPYTRVSEQMGQNAQSHGDVWREFVGGWNGQLYRFIFCAESDDQFTSSIQRAGTSPAAEERLIQERALFTFIICGLSAVECFCYGLCGIASIVDPTRFKVTDPAYRSKISPEQTRDQFAAKGLFSQEPVTGSLQTTLGHQQYRDWKELRNILIHRSTPGRGFYRGGPLDSQAIWSQSISINATTTPSRRTWLSGAFTDLLVAAEQFAAEHL